MGDKMNGLEVTHVEFRDYKNKSMVAWADVTFNGCMTVQGFKIFESREGGYWCSPPSEQKEYKGETRWFDRVRFPKEWREEGNPVTESIVKMFNDRSSGSSSGGQSDDRGKRPGPPF